MTKPDIVGSWFNTGYHGHFRSKPRSDFINEYRQIAKPAPPRVFLFRSQQPTKIHSFTHHDNKSTMNNSAVYFEQGHGLKKCKGAAPKYNPDFLAWYPLRTDYEGRAPLLSLYKTEYRMRRPGEEPKQLIVTRPKTSFDTDQMATTYRYTYCSDNPNKDLLKAAVDYKIPVGLNVKPKKSFTGARDSVASCLVWNYPKHPETPFIDLNLPCENQSRRNVPAATEISVPAESNSAFLQQSAHAFESTTPNGSSTILPAPSTQGCNEVCE